MLALEQAARLTMADTIAQISKGARANTGASVVQAADQIESGIIADLTRVRAATRRVSREKFAVEIHAATGQPLMADDSTAGDHASAVQAAKAHSAAWLAMAIDNLDSDDAAGAASKATSGRIETMAMSEVATQFSVERSRLGAEHARYAKRSALPVPLKIWWADRSSKNICRVCRRLDGAIRPFGVGFTADLIPGRVHPRCRCFESVTVVGFVRQQDERDSM